MGKKDERKLDRTDVEKFAKVEVNMDEKKKLMLYGFALGLKAGNIAIGNL